MTAQGRNRIAHRFLPLLAGAFTTVASPVLPALADTPDNAALLYLRYATLQQSELSGVDRELALIDWADDAEHRALLERHAAITEGFLRATMIERCDFGVEEDTLFFNATMPHLAQMRAAARLLAADARRLTHDDPMAAAERVAAIVRLADHTADGDFLITSLVGMAISQLAIGEIERLHEQGALTPDVARVLAMALDRLPKDDPWRLKSAIQGERDVAVEMARRCIELWEQGQDEAAGKLASVTPQLRGVLSAMDRNELEKEITQLSAYYEAVLVLWDRGGGTERYEPLTNSLEAGSFGAFTSIIAPAIGNVERARERGDQALIEARTLVRNAMERVP